VTSDSTDPEPEPPSRWRIGRYRVDAVLGTGAFATVYRAVDERLEDTVAVKVLAENHSLDLEIRKRFMTEGRVLRRIDSPHVIDVHDLGETERQQPFLVLEYARRGTLAQRVHALRATGWRPAPADLWAVAEPLGHALDAVHRAGVVHRDVNPTNVLLTTRGDVGQARSAAVVRDDERLILADLGLCKDLALHSGHTSAGGTEGFRPPELRGGPAIIDGRADLWSLSALLVWLATGSPPDGTPVGTAISGAGLPPGLGRMLDRSLADDPHVRHPDALSWLSEAEAALTAPGFGVPTRWSAHAGDGHRSSPRQFELQPGHVPWTGRDLVGRPPHIGPRDLGMPGMGPPGASPLPTSAAVPVPRSWGWRLRRSAWVLTSLPFGLTTWVGFLFVGLSAQRSSWLWAAGAYAAGAGLLLVLILATPTDSTGAPTPGSWQDTLSATTMAILWVGGFVHALLANRRWLRWRAASG
jgi:serine/threonine protein kinase